MLVVKRSFWKDRAIFLTGHTGFKGGWLALWLTHLGAKVHGFSLAAPTSPSFYVETNLEDRIESSTMGDIRDLSELTKALRAAEPSLVFHMAAQALVKRSYEEPVDTFATNLLGTVNTFEAVRCVDTVEAIINVTTDKCYENTGRAQPYTETDRLGGYDPYSTSKACAELAAAAYRSSFLADAGIYLATVRAGNVIGGGDWAKDRLIPDFLRAYDAHQALPIRSPGAVRPWQHVLEPLSGYLMLGESLFSEGEDYAEAWNFGPKESDAKTVAWLVDHLCQRLPTAKWHADESQQPHEAKLLKLDSSKARVKLGWRPRWSVEIALAKTLEWHQAWRSGRCMSELSLQQIEAYQSA